MSGPVYSAAVLADIVGVHRPTEEQAAIIEAAREPTVIIAGAGSGKTETLALRVLWLIANDYADPQRILGLTFTRKAVGELTERIWAFVRTFRRAVRTGRAQAARAAAVEGTAESGSAGSGFAARGGFADLEMPTISTYNSYAASLVSDYGLAIGIETDASVLDAAGSIRMAERVVLAAADAEIPAGASRTAVISQVREMASQINEHLQTPEAVIEHLDACIDRLLSAEGLEDYAAAIRRGRSVPKEEKDAVIAEMFAQAERAGVGGRGRGHGDGPARDALIDMIIGLRSETALQRLVNKRRVAVLAARFLAAKREASVMEFSDQVKFAYDIMSMPDSRVLPIERSRWDAIMLDEYQDTSDSQFQLLQKLFNGKNVMAVGDPRQSIYAWRGASARNISDFPTRFQRILTDDQNAAITHADAHVRTLSIGWRNDESILAIANRISEALPEYEEDSRLRRSPIAGPGDTRVSTTIGEPDARFGTDLMAELVGFMDSATEAWYASGKDRPPERAVLCRKRAALAPAAAALEEAGYTVHVAGTAGLLDDPFVADLHAVLHAIVDPNAAEEVMRLIAGRSCALGAADIAALNTFSRLRDQRAQQAFADSLERGAAGSLARGSGGQGGSPAAEVPGAGAVAGEAPGSGASAAAPGRGAAADAGGVVSVGLIEALDDLIAVTSALSAADTSAAGPRHSPPVVRDWQRSGLSETATLRLITLAERLRSLRRLSATVPGIVRAAIVEFDIDTEIAALPQAARRLHQRALDAFVSHTGDFVAQNPGGDLADFLTWLSIMDAEASLAMPEEPAADGAVAVMTVHGSKGLGFDIVAVPHLSTGDMPTKVTGTWAWLSGGLLPYPLRGDRAHIPRFDLRDADLGTESAIAAYRKGPLAEALAEHHGTEERRIGYVAMTRAKKHLWLGASLFTTRKQPNEFSPYLQEAIDVLGLDAEELLHPGGEDVERPAFTAPAVDWPAPADHARAAARDRLREVLAAAAAEAPSLESLAEPAEAEARTGEKTGDEDADAAEVAVLARQARELLAERRQLGADLRLPGRMSATGLVDFADDPDAYLRELARPMPHGPSHAAGLGTAFHAWVENYYGQAALSDLDDVQETASLPGYLREQFEMLCRRFESSRFAAMEPVAVEQSFELVLTGAEGRRVTVPGKIDAIFASADGLYVVDWKTGSSPRTQAELAARAVQLAVYRMAVMRMERFQDVGRVDCGFYFLGDDREVSVDHLMSEEELIARLGL